MWNYCFIGFAAMITGCKCVYLTSEHMTKIAQYRADGRLAEARAEMGRTVSLAPTMAWALVLGANQIHIMRKINQSPYASNIQRECPGLTNSLGIEGIVAILFSWIPFIYEFIVPIDMGTCVSDVFASNNLAWMYHVESEGKLKD